MWALSSFRRIKGREKKEKYWIHNVFQATAEKKAEKTKILDSYVF
jgi:hypothetical protein